jgi:succinoglycan biosynthesis protein ExoA
VRDSPEDPGAFRPLVVIPSLNEADHIERVVRQMADAVHGAGGRVVVADGGSGDGTWEVAEGLAGTIQGVVAMRNPARFQAPGINAAVARYGDGFTHLVRIDAHAAYPDDYIDVLRDEALATGAASIVVGMTAEGQAALQRISAQTQNARIGNGGSHHRAGGGGRFVDHGHHALMRIDAFREVGGYDEGFTHNEDAELDYRLTRAGHRIWLTGRTQVTYFPRATLGTLARQYFNHGKGRARNLMKHAALPRLRQAAVISVAPVLLLAAFAPVLPVLGLPALFWTGAACLGGAAIALRQRDAMLLLAGPVAMVMHASWSLGFWVEALAPRARAARRASA